MSLFNYIYDRMPSTKRGFTTAYISMAILFISTPLWLMLIGANETITMITYISSMVVAAFFFMMVGAKHQRFNDQQESHRRKDSNKNTVFYKFGDDSEWYSIYLNGHDGEAEQKRKQWRYIKNDPTFKRYGTWEMGGTTDEWEKREKREKRLKKILKK